jgi:predicted dehydrogenase
MQRLRIGIVGCGEVTQIMHLPSLNQLAEQFVVTALCDVSDTVLQVVSEQWRVEKRYHEYQELVAQDDVDAVLVANPDAYHTEVALAAIAAGKHVLIEKPMCMTL